MLTRPASQCAAKAAAFACLALPLGPSVRAQAQARTTPPESATAAPARVSTSKSANVKTGDIASIDAAGDTLTLRDHAGKSASYISTAKTHYFKNRRAVQRSDFKAGDSVVLHFRRSRSDDAMLITELDDPASWTWLSGVRKTTTSATVKVITDDTLSVGVGPDNLPLDYTISAKTRWEKAGKEADASAFKPGDRVFIVPRSLPSGAIMARAVADSTTGAAQEKERLATSVHGTLTGVDAPAHKLVLKTVSGDTRSLAYSDDTEVVVAGKPASLSTLKSGMHVAARIRHQADGDEEVWRLTVESARKPAASKKRSPTVKGAVTGH